MTAGGIPEGDDFVRQWNALDGRERRRLRRMVRMGQPLEDRRRARVAVAYARFQRSRFWSRLFWVWFLPGLVLAMGAAVQIHPVLIGVVLALAAQAVFAHRNLGRAEQVNASALGPTAGSPPPPSGSPDRGRS